MEHNKTLCVWGLCDCDECSSLREELAREILSRESNKENKVERERDSKNKGTKAKYQH